MQHSFECPPDKLSQIEAAMSQARLTRFAPDESSCRNHALRMYVWNARLCAEFYIPLQTAEICIRNAIADTLTRRFTSGWYNSKAVNGFLTDKYREELAKIVQREQSRKGAKFTVDHVVSGLSFGFWVHLITARYENHLWQQGVRRTFPHATPDITRDIAHQKIDQLRRFRNKVAHHYAIFDRSPLKEYQNLEVVLGWVSPDSVWLIRQICSPARVINTRPKPTNV